MFHATAASGADRPIELQPTTQWEADFADDSCALRRGFGNGGIAAALELRQFAPGHWIDAKVVSGDLDMRARDPKAYFQPDTPDDDPGPVYQTYSIADGRKGVIVATSLLNRADRAADRKPGLFRLSEADRDNRERELTGLVLTGAFAEDLILHTGPMNAPMKVMRACLDDLLMVWGIDPEAHRSRTRDVELKDSEPFWRRLGKAVVRASPGGGSVTARIMVDEAGRSTDCRVLEGVEPGQKSDDFCREMRAEAKFEPALDSSAQPMKSFYLLEFSAIRRTF